jgi:hypothetical protein
MKFGKNRGQTTVADASDVDGGTDHLQRREKRGREKRERKSERSRRQFKSDLVAPVCLP